MTARYVAVVGAVVALIAVRGVLSQVPSAAVNVVIEASLSADGRQVAYTRAPRGAVAALQALLAVSFAGGEPRLLAPPEALLTQVKWSPDGRQVAFVSRGIGARAAGRVQVVAANGGAPRPLTDGKADLLAVQWSFDGTSLLFLSQAVGGGGRRVGVINLGGAAAAPEFPELLADDRPRSPTPPIAGATVLFTDWVGSDRQSITLTNGRETWIDLLTIANGVRVTVMPPGTATILRPPSWSADGSRFVVVGETAEHGAEVFAGSLPVPVSGRPDYVGAPPPPVRRITSSNP